MHELEVVAPAFVEMAHRIVWCSAASVDARGRPRSRVLHPIWEWDGRRLRGWIAIKATATKRAHLAASPFLSLDYWHPSQPRHAAASRSVGEGRGGLRRADLGVVHFPPRERLRLETEVAISQRAEAALASARARPARGRPRATGRGREVAPRAVGAAEDETGLETSVAATAAGSRAGCPRPRSSVARRARGTSRRCASRSRRSRRLRARARWRILSRRLEQGRAPVALSQAAQGEVMGREVVDAGGEIRELGRDEVEVDVEPPVLG